MAESHIQGATKQGYGSITSGRGVNVTFGTATGVYGIVDLVPDNTSSPLLVKVTLVKDTAFDGTGAALKIQSYDGTTATDIISSANTAVASAGVVTSAKVFTTATKIQIDWTIGTTPTAGNAWVFIEVVGRGKGKYLGNSLEA